MDGPLVLNQINHLAKHKTVSKDTRTAKGTGRWEYVYGKIDFVMANKQEILRKYNNPKLLAKMPTKRRPQITGAILIRPKTRRSSPKAAGKKLKVLYLTAAPAPQAALRTEAEFRSVQRELRGSIYRNSVEVFISPAADAKSILDGINDHRPHIVHFSGHGGGKAIWLDDGKIENSVGRPMKFELLAQALRARP